MSWACSSRLRRCSPAESKRTRGNSMATSDKGQLRCSADVGAIANSQRPRSFSRRIQTLPAAASTKPYISLSFAAPGVRASSATRNSSRFAICRLTAPCVRPARQRRESRYRNVRRPRTTRARERKVVCVSWRITIRLSHQTSRFLRGSTRQLGAYLGRAFYTKDARGIYGN